MLQDLWIKHREWVFEPIYCSSVGALIGDLDEKIIEPAKGQVRRTPGEEGPEDERGVHLGGLVQSTLGHPCEGDMPTSPDHLTPAATALNTGRSGPHANGPS
jgi:hypothetical protein